MSDPGATDPALASALSRIWRQRRADVEELLGVVESAVAQHIEGSLDGALCEEARRAAHRLAGSLGTFGLARGSALARHIETALDQRDTAAPGDVHELAELTAELIRSVASFDGPPAGPEPSRASEPGPGWSPDRRTVYLVGMEDGAAELVAEEAAVRGVRVVVTIAHEAAHPAGPHGALVVDLDHADLPDARDTSTGVGPVVALSSGRRFADRVRAARLGAKRYLSKPASAAEILDAVEALWPTTRPAATVVAVDDDPIALDLLHSLLSPEGISIITVSDQEEFWQAIEHHTPAVVILDVDMPGIDGIELCRVLRSDERWQQTGVVFLTGHRDADTLRAAFAAGADDLVVKPIVGPELTARIRSRIERSDLHRRLADTDGLTGLANRSALGRNLDHLLTGDDEDHPLVFALVDLDHFKRVNDTYGHRVGDEVIRRLANLIPSADPLAAGRWGGEEFALLFAGATTEEAVRRTCALLERFQAERFNDGHGGFHVSFSAGVATYPHDARDALGLYRLADAALYRAKARGRARVVSARELAPDASAVRPVDVVVIDDDEVLATLLVDTIASEGWSVQRFADGLDAVAHLSGPRADLQPRAIVLDVDLPGLDGYAVLRRLAHGPVLVHTRVIMLTARAREDDLGEAFQLGAHDHMAKPFSVPVLIERLRRILAR